MGGNVGGSSTNFTILFEHHLFFKMVDCFSFLGTPVEVKVVDIIENLLDLLDVKLGGKFGLHDAGELQTLNLKE